MEDIINLIAGKINELSSRRQQLADTLKQADSLKISKFRVPIDEFNLDKIKICGVDGGFLKKEYHGINLLLRRAVAVCFSYENGMLKGADYYPSRKPVPEPVGIGSEFSEVEFGAMSNLKRSELELITALAAIKKFEPNVLVLDGSIVPYPSNQPDKDSKAYKAYLDIINLHKKLFEVCSKNKILLVGAVEDSKGKKYCNLLLEKALPNLLKTELSKELKDSVDNNKDILYNTTDTLFLFYLLNKGERTAAMPYAEENAPAVKDLGEYKKAIHATYIKAVEFDRPLRLDFLAPKDTEEIAAKISSIIWAISRQNQAYAYPSVLIEADARAKLAENELQFFKASLNEKLGNNPSLFELRREMRPF